MSADLMTTQRRGAYMVVHCVDSFSHDGWSEVILTTPAGREIARTAAYFDGTDAFPPGIKEWATGIMRSRC